MIKTETNGIVTLSAEENAYLTNERVFSKLVYLGKNANESDWRDAADEEYEEWQRQQEEPESTAEELLDIIMGVTE